MATWNSRGLRGSALEELINFTNDTYLKNHLALIQKIPTPITPMKIDRETRHITLAYFDKKSTVDYIGVIQGIPIRCKTFMLIRFRLCRILNSKRALHLLFCIIRHGMSIIICLTVI